MFTFIIYTASVHSLYYHVNPRTHTSHTLHAHVHTCTPTPHTHTHTHTQLLRVNHQWDLEYKEQEEAFRRYRIDSQQAQHENQTYIAKLKEEKDYQSHEIASLQRDLRRAGGSGDSQIEVTSLKREVSQYEKIIGTLKQRNHDLEEQMYTGAGRHGDGRKVKQLEEEILLLKQQVSNLTVEYEFIKLYFGSFPKSRQIE